VPGPRSSACGAGVIDVARYYWRTENDLDISTFSRWGGSADKQFGGVVRHRARAFAGERQRRADPPDVPALVDQTMRVLTARALWRSGSTQPPQYDDFLRWTGVVRRRIAAGPMYEGQW